MPDSQGGSTENTPQFFESHPPAWLPKVHSSADLGYHGFYPPRTGQDEDVLSENNVKNGFTLNQQVLAETFSANTMINGDLSSETTFSKLETLMNEIFIRKAENLPSIPPATFRIPARVTLNDAKRQSWFADLANPDVPLYRLGKSVPHGAKGHDLLDLLQAKNIAIPRAVWFLRVFGANETAGLRNKPTYNPMQYSTDWANVVTSYMKKQLADIALPSAPRPGLNIKQTFKGVLSDGDSRERWVSRFVYCLKLLRSFYSEGLVDKRIFLVWVVQQIMTCNLAQTGFITRLADDYLDGLLGCRPLARPLLQACLAKLIEIRSTSAQEFLRDTEGLLIVLVQRLCVALPDSFVSPRMWKTYNLLLAEILNQNVIGQCGNSPVERNSHEVSQVLSRYFVDIKKRNEALLFQSLPVQDPVPAHLGSAVSDIKLLNSISSATDMSSIQFFTPSTYSDAGFSDKLDMLLTWSVTPLQFGDHRPFAAVTIIRNWRMDAADRATRRHASLPDEFLQDRLFDWLDSSDAAGDPENIRAVSLLFGKLVKNELFSYASYVQRLVARGETGLSTTEESETRHRSFLRWIPLPSSTSPLISQRKLILYGARAREMPEDSTEREIRREIRAVLSDLFGGEFQLPLVNTSALTTSCELLLSSPRFEQVRTLRHWLLPLLKKYITRQAALPGPALLRTYSVSVELMCMVKCYHSALDLTICLLENSVTLDLLTAVIDTLHRFSTIWTCMNEINTIVVALDKAHQAWRARGIQSRPLLSLLLQFDAGRSLDIASRQRISADVAIFSSTLQPATDRPDIVPDVLPEILLLAGDLDPDAPSLLANSLWIKYRRSVDWAWKVWDNTVASLRQVPVMTSDEVGRRNCALRYGILLWHVDQHLAMGLDGEIFRWFTGPGRSEIAALSSEAWDVLIIVLLYLSIHGALKTTTILQGLVYPAWQQAAKSDQPSPALETSLRSANDICRRLLLSDEINHDLPPVDLLELQSIRTRRQEVYSEAHFPLLASTIPVLISLQNNHHISEQIRVDSTSLRHSISQNSDFRQGAYRNLDAIREAFERSLHPSDSPGGILNKHIVAGLRLLLYDLNVGDELSEWPTVTSMLSPWKIAATMVQMQLILKEMGQELLRDPQSSSAHSNLDRLISMLLNHSMSSEQATYVGEMARGVDNVVAEKFIENGIRCITESLVELTPTTSSLSAPFQRAGELLRVMIYVSGPLREDVTNSFTLDPSVQDAFVAALLSRLTAMEPMMTSLGTEDISFTQDIVIFLRLLQFQLNFGSSLSSQSKDATGRILSSLFKLSIYISSNDPNSILYPLILDTIYYVYDEMPLDSKATPYDPFCPYLDATLADLLAALPREHHKQLSSLLPLLPDTSAVANLVNSQRDASGNMIYGAPVVNRSWEWIENLGEPTVLDANEEDRDKEEKERFESRYAVKNSSSLSLEVFGARFTGDGVLRNSNTDQDYRRLGKLRSFGDGLSAENLFNRDWRETRVDLDPDGGNPGIQQQRSNEGNEQVGSSSYSGVSQPEKRPTPRGSPAPSNVSRGSTSSKGVLNRNSSSTISEIIDVDSATTVTSKQSSPNKRKASAVSDDEIEIIENPVPAQPSKKAKGKSAAKSKKR